MARIQKLFFSFLPFVCVVSLTEAFVANSKLVTFKRQKTTGSLLHVNINDQDNISIETDRRSMLASILTTTATVTTFLTTSVANADDEAESIIERAARIAKTVEAENPTPEEPKSQASKSTNTQTVYDFSLPVAGQQKTFTDLIHQEFEPVTEEGAPPKAIVKAILVVNIKQDDPIARKNIAEFIGLASKYGQSGLAIVSIPTDQGYFEPDTSALIRLKLSSEYGYGINPATILTDKINFLGTGANPFARWIQGTCRTPSGLGKIQANFEKFLVDGQTGLPIRRYPRKYNPYDISNDIESLLKGQPLPPPIANFNEEWRAAAIDAEKDTYRFQKGLNVFDE